MTASTPATTGRRRRKPVWQEVEEQDARRLSSRARTANRRRRPLAVVYDIEGPRVRLGIAWFVVVVAALALGAFAVAVVYGTAAALAGAQAARAWRRTRRRRAHPNVAVAAGIGAVLPLAAAVSTPVLGMAVLAAVAAALASGGTAAGVRTLQCGIWPGAAAAAVVVSDRIDTWTAVALVLAVSAYEIGDYLVGSGARNAVEGPVAGAAAVLVVASAAGLIAFGVPHAVWMAVLAAALCPVGQLAASLVLPSVRAHAPALRRLDSLLVLGPVWAWAGGLLVQSAGS